MNATDGLIIWQLSSLNGFDCQRASTWTREGQAKVDTYGQGRRGKSKCAKNVWTSFMDGSMQGAVQEQNFYTNKVHNLELFAWSFFQIITSYLNIYMHLVPPKPNQNWKSNYPDMIPGVNIIGGKASKASSMQALRASMELGDLGVPPSFEIHLPPKCCCNFT